MEGTTTFTARGGVLSVRGTIDLGALCGWLLPVALIGYLGVRQGGYDTVISSQVAIAAWWVILLLLAFGLVRARLGRAGSIGIGLLAGYAAWTTLSLAWTESSESTMTDVSQMLLYVGLMLLVLLVRGRQAIRFMVYGLATGIVAITVVALLSRLHFQWFAVPAVNSAVPTATKRLSYPIEYWNALAALMAIGIPALLYCASGARSTLARASAGACLPLLALCAFLTASRGGIIEIAAGLVVFVALAPERLAKLAIIAAAGAGSALLIAAANQRAALREGLRSTLTAHQGNQLIAIAIAVAFGVALLVAAIVLVERHVERPRLLVIPRRQLTRFSAAGLLVAIIAFLAAGGVGFLGHKWDQFKSPIYSSGSTAFARLQSSSGEGRYQYWQAAVQAADRKPLTGTGANTFQFQWLQHGTTAGGFVIDAHSLYVQALGDLGYPGLVLIAGFILWILGCGVWRVVRSRDPAHRLALAAATAGAFAFAVSAAIDWIWFIPVLPVALFVCAGVIFAPEQTDSADGSRTLGARRRFGALLRKRGVRAALQVSGALACLAVIVVIAVPMAATEAVRESQSLVATGNLSAALERADEAVQLQPYAAAGWLQEALVQEQAHNLGAALKDAEQAKDRQPVNWSNWLVVSRLEARTGHASAALADYDHARLLNPHNPLFS